MYPLTCPDGATHEFEESPAGTTCTKCRLHYNVYTEAIDESEATRSAIKSIVNILNNCNKDFIAHAVYEEMRHTHRTLQQSFIGMLAAFIGHMKGMETDAHNKSAVGWCKKVAEIDQNFPTV
jgi:hypothetical protein